MDIIPDPRIQQLQPEWYQPYVKEVAMLRLDEVHAVVSGNKWFKLKQNIDYALREGYDTVLTFGGGYSSHLIATAAAAKHFGLKSIGIVRGLYDELTPTLISCSEFGMQLEFVTQQEYKNRAHDEWPIQWTGKYGKVFVIPEGGANEWGRKGAGEIAKFIPSHYTHICISVGTGTTMEGMCNYLQQGPEVLGYVPMKNGCYLAEEIAKYIPSGSWQLFDDWHFGGFGKSNAGLVAFMNEFYRMHQIPLDMVYTGKMMYGVQEQITTGFFPHDASILCIHTGGLQGNANIADRLEY